MTQPRLETDRLIIREMLLKDAEGMFEMDSDPRVLLYLNMPPVKSVVECENAIRRIRKEYIEKGIGRWAVEEKKSGQFVGWTGFKINTVVINGHKGLFDLGYRFVESAWGKGYATEVAHACLAYAFQYLPYDPIYGAADIRNGASNHILKKMGMKYLEEFEFEGVPHYFYSIDKTEWFLQNPDS